MRRSVAGLAPSWRLVVLVAALLSICANHARAADDEPTTFWKRLQEKGLYERVWDRLRLYENEENPVLQSLSVIGRYQGQYASVDADQGTTDGWENRRTFMGAEAMLYHQWILHAQIKASEDYHPFYDGLYQAFVKWEPSDSVSVTAGRIDWAFTGLERSMASTRIVTFERGLLVNQITPNEAVGAILVGEHGAWSYRAGILSGDIEREFTDFSGGIGIDAGAGRDLPLFYDTGALHLDYLFNDGNAANNALKPYDHQLSLWHRGHVGAFDMGVDLTWAHGLDARPAVFGATVLPTLIFAKQVIRKGDALQAVMRYQYASSDGDNGLQLQQRYERDVVPGGSGDRYQAVYGGINYLIFGDRLKLMTGIEYSSMRDSAHDGGEFSGWTSSAGLRVFF